jgi:hypothetical protein
VRCADTREYVERIDAGGLLIGGSMSVADGDPEKTIRVGLCDKHANELDSRK